jgi:hypothetical protein
MCLHLSSRSLPLKFLAAGHKRLQFLIPRRLRRHRFTAIRFFAIGTIS